MATGNPVTIESPAENRPIHRSLAELACDTRFLVDRVAFVVMTPQYGPRTSRLVTNGSVSMPESFSST